MQVLVVDLFVNIAGERLDNKALDGSLQINILGGSYELPEHENLYRMEETQYRKKYERFCLVI